MPAERLGWLYYPGDSTLAQVGVAMRATDALAVLPPLMQRANFADAESLREDREWCAEILREAIDYLSRFPSPAGDADASVDLLRAHLAITLGEIGDWDEMLEELDHLKQSDRSFAQFSVWCRAVYASETKYPLPDTLSEDEMTRLAEHWTRWLFEERVASLTGDQAKIDHLAQWRKDLAQKQAGYIALFTLLNWSIFGAGLIWLVKKLRQRAWKAPPAPLPRFPRSFTGGLALFFGGQFLGMMLLGLVWETAETDSAVLRHYSFLLGFPTVLLMWIRQVYRPVELGLPGPDEGIRLAARGLGVFPPISLSLAVPALILAQIGYEGHWTESWREGERGLPWPEWLGPLINAAIWAALFEEIAFRWLLYGGLRQRLPVLPALAISSLLFGLAHHYSAAGFLSVTLFGAMNCLLYERTGSWIPGFVVHGLANFLIISEETLCLS
jgi:membrane protease YdiL (CAAX protease family)